MQHVFLHNVRLVSKFNAVQVVQFSTNQSCHISDFAKFTWIELQWSLCIRMTDFTRNAELVNEIIMPHPNVKIFPLCLNIGVQKRIGFKLGLVVNKTFNSCQQQYLKPVLIQISKNLILNSYQRVCLKVEAMFC